MLIKKFVSYLLLPYPGALALLLTGAILLWFTARQRTGKTLVTIAATTLLLFSSGALAGWYTTPLDRYPPLASIASLTEVRWIVVLGGGYSNVTGLPATSRLGSDSLERLVEAVRLYRTRPGAKLVVSGGAYQSATTLADVMGDAAQLLGIPAGDIVREDASDDTQDQARLVRKLVGQEPFALVTSAMHMRRAMKLFEKQGLRPVAAPTGFRSARSSALPHTGQLGAAEAAEHEYLGMLWSRLRGTL